MTTTTTNTKDRTMTTTTTNQGSTTQDIDEITAANNTTAAIQEVLDNWDRVHYGNNANPTEAIESHLAIVEAAASLFTKHKNGLKHQLSIHRANETAPNWHAVAVSEQVADWGKGIVKEAIETKKMGWLTAAQLDHQI
tara:strand:+ start:1817 stop:2230 length:414 start_codon:yes stop_codon:yes gene_type:complete